MNTKHLPLAEIRLDSGTQTRNSTNEEAVAEYAERMAAGDEFPPVEVFFDGKEYHCADGFHRILAASRCRLESILSNIRQGTVADAIWFAIGANRANGIQRTAGDKRHAIKLALAKFPEKTQEAIAEHVGCANGYVAKVQSELLTSEKLTIPATRVGKDGKSYPTSYKKADKPKEKKEAAETLPHTKSETTEAPQSQAPCGDEASSEAPAGHGQPAGLRADAPKLPKNEAEALSAITDPKAAAIQLDELVSRWIDQGTKEQLEMLLKSAKHAVKNLESVIESI